MMIMKNQNLPGLAISKSKEKKIKNKKNKSKLGDEDFVWGSLETHPVFNAKKDEHDKKRNAASQS